MYETMNWESFLAFNNAFGLANVPTGAIIDAAGDTAGGTITAGNVSIPPVLPLGQQHAALRQRSINCFNSPCPIMRVDRNITTPYVWNWTLNLQHAFTPNVSLEMAYVGNHGSNLMGIRDINQPPVGSGWPAANIAACTQAASATGPSAQYPTLTNPACQDDTATKTGPTTPFPYLRNIFQMGNVYRSNYNGLQVTLNSRNYHGLSMVAGYTYSHALDDVGANWDFGYGAGLPQDSTIWRANTPTAISTCASG